MYLFYLAHFGGTNALPMDVPTPSKCLKVFLCLAGTSKNNLVHGALIDAEILTSQLPHVFAQLGPLLGADALSMGMPTPPKWSKSVPMCIINLQKKFGAWGFNRC